LKFKFLGVALISIIFFTISLKAEILDESKEDILLLNFKIGSQHTIFEKLKSGNFKLTSKAHSKVMRGGTTITVDALLTEYADNMFRPLGYFLIQVTGGNKKIIKAIRKNNKMIIDIKDEYPRKVVLTLESNDMYFSSMLKYIVRKRGIKLGKRFEFNCIDEESCSIVKESITVKQKTKIFWQGVEHEVYELINKKSNMPGITMKAFLNNKFEVLRAELGPITLIKVEDTNKRKYSKKDLLTLFLIDPAYKAKDFSKNIYLKLKLSLDKSLDPYQVFYLNKRQKITRENNKLFIEIKKPEMFEESAGEKVKNYLVSKGLILVDEKIKNRALEITKGIKGLKALRSLTNWVFRNLSKSFNKVIDSSVVINKTLEGDCTEHAIYLAALLRAVNIPARCVVGLMFLDGKFYYHMWTEAYLKKGWISIDPSFNQVNVDVGHIKFFHTALAQESPSDVIAKFLKHIKKIKLKVVKVK